MGDPTRPMALSSQPTRWVVASTISLLLIGALVAFNSSERTLPSLGSSFDVQDPTSELASSVVGFLLGTRGTNVCPADSVSVGTEAQCRSAATTLGRTWGWSGTWSYAPKGCFFSSVNRRVYFNADPTGAGQPDSAPICTGSTASPTASPTAEQMMRRRRKAEEHN